jgi:hypothetical protein
MRWFVLLLGLALAGCNQYYMKYCGDYGYSDLEYGKRIEVTYVGSGTMTITDSRKYALYRMAHLAYLNGMRYVKITDELIDKNRVRVRKDAQTSYSESTDSLGNKDVTMVSTPRTDSVFVKPVVTLIGIQTNECDSNCIDVQDMVRMAQREGIEIEE